VDRLTISVCNLPRDFYRVRTKSVVQLLRECGFIGGTAQLSREAIIEVLNSDPSLIQEWMNYSGNKRTSSGWFLLENGRVGHLDARPNASRNVRLDLEPIAQNLTFACAEFIIKETGSIRDHALKRLDGGDQSNSQTNSSSPQT
jgi:hypothetical protein